VFLERVLVDGQPVSLTEGVPLQLGPATGSLDFFFTAISFTSPQKVRFRYKLENSDTDWVQNDEARRAHYGPLQPGRYLFRVRACNAAGIWNEDGASLAVWVSPPLWRAWWFVTASAFVIVAGIWALARFISTRRLQARLRAAEQRHAMERERARIAQDMHDEIGSKLTRISFLSEVARNAGTEANAVAPPVEAIASTSRELLQALDEIVWAVNPRNDSLEHLAGYLEQHAREYFQATSVECEIQVPAQLPHVHLTAEVRHNVFLAFEEALNNSLKHARASRVQVAMRIFDSKFEVQVQDDGIGFADAPEAAPGHDGMRNMQERLRAVGGECEFSGSPGGGVTVAFRFPLAQTSAGKAAYSDSL
jgi:signal transduction histidine kinase